jgi:hypothetical protein
MAGGGNSNLNHETHEKHEKRWGKGMFSLFPLPPDDLFCWPMLALGCASPTYLASWLEDQEGWRIMQ